MKQNKKTKPAQDTEDDGSSSEAPTIPGHVSGDVASVAEVKPPPNDPPKCDGGQEGPPKEPSVAPQKPDHKSEVIPSQKTNPVAPLSKLPKSSQRLIPLAWGEVLPWIVTRPRHVP